MKCFLFCYAALIATTVSAVPHYGYNYERNSLAGNTANSNNINNAHNFFNPGAEGSTSNQLHQQQQTKSDQTFGGGEKYLPPSSTTAAPIITKQFYLVSAPEEQEATPKTKHFVLGRAQRNYRVVFIKAPAPENTNLKLTAEYAPQEEKTVIYVLSKKDNELDIGEISTPAPTQPTKPEVFFIKYKTPEEASAAQKEIQEQYDHLGGTSEFSDEGVVPVKSVVGSLDGLAANGGYDYKRVQNGANSAIKDFLQPNRYYY